MVLVWYWYGHVDGGSYVIVCVTCCQIQNLMNDIGYSKRSILRNQPLETQYFTCSMLDFSFWLSFLAHILETGWLAQGPLRNSGWHRRCEHFRLRCARDLSAIGCTALILHMHRHPALPLQVRLHFPLCATAERPLFSRTPSPHAM